MTPIVVSKQVCKNNSASHRLFRSSFSILEVQGAIAELRLYCDKGFLGLVYHVKEDWSYCFLVAFGDPGTTFSIVEM